MIKRSRMVVALATAAMVVAGCAGMSRQEKGTLGGAAAGAAAGTIVSDSIWGVLLGAAVGGVAGNLIGKDMDKQARELEQAVPSAEVNRVGEGINMTFSSGLMFALNSATIDNAYKPDLDAAAAVFRKYPDTNILVEGHTDDTGTDAYNLSLSQRRAAAVASYLENAGVAARRMQIRAYGEAEPKYPNDSEMNRAKNRRVELGVYANAEMKADAKAGNL